jgi:RNA polymerase sigma factor (sigma-70 family)
VSGDSREKRQELEALMRWAIGVGRRVVLRRGMLRHAEEVARVSLLALSEALARYDASAGELKPFAAMWIVGEVNKALDKERDRDEHEVPADDAGHHDVHPSLRGEELVDDIVDGIVSLYVDEELRTNGEARLLKREAHAALHRAIDLLEAEDRRLVELRYWEEQTWREVAEELRISETTAKERDVRIRAALLTQIIAWDRVRPLRRKA